MINTEDNIVIAKTEFDHLIRLLDDEDENIYSNIRERFISYGDDTAVFLKNFLNDENVLIKKRAGEIITTINFDKIEKKLLKLSNSDENEILEKAIFIISEYGYPELNIKKYSGILDKMAGELKSELILINENIHLIKPVKILNTISAYLFSKKGFKGNTENYSSPDNSYINKVIDSKAGIPVSLSIVYLLIARRLKIPVFGINLPGHFILKYNNGNEEYFIDPFNKGIIISKKEASDFILNSGMNPDEFEKIPYLKNSGDKEIILRVLRNLSEIYTNEKDYVKISQIEKLMLCLV